MKIKTAILNIICFLLILYAAIIGLSLDICIIIGDIPEFILMLFDVINLDYIMAVVFLSIIAEMILFIKAVLFDKYYIQSISKTWKHIFLTTAVIGFILTLNLGYLNMVIISV